MGICKRVTEGHGQELWQLLEKRYRGHGSIAIHGLIRVIVNGKLQEEKQFEQFVDKRREAIERLKAGKCDLPTQLLAVTFLDGIRHLSAFSSLNAYFASSTASSSLDYDTVLEAARQLFELWMSNSSRKPVRPPTPVMPVDAGKKFDGKCMYCDNVGHKAAQCRIFKSDQQKGTVKPGARTHIDWKTYVVSAVANISKKVKRKTKQGSEAGVDIVDILAIAAESGRPHDIQEIQVPSPSKSSVSKTRRVLVDSGCARHLWSVKSEMRSLEDCNVVLRVADGSTSNISQQGELLVRSSAINKMLKFQNVVYAPHIGDILSVKQILKSGHKVFFESGNNHILLKSGVIVPSLEENDQFYIEIQVETQKDDSTAEVSDVKAGEPECSQNASLGDVGAPKESAQENNVQLSSSEMILWHERLGRPGIRQMMELSDRVEGVPAKCFSKNQKFVSKLINECEPCHAGKDSRPPKYRRRATEHRAEEEGGCLHVDLVGPLPKSRGGAKYAFVAVDEYSNWTTVVPIPDKTAESTTDAYKEVLYRMKRDKYKAMKSDNGKEFHGELDAYLKSQNISHLWTPPYTPSTNGKVERMNRSLFERVRTMLAHSKIPASFWPYAALHAEWSMNRVSGAYLKHKGRKANVQYAKVFGCKCFVNLSDSQYLKKLQEKSEVGTFLGYSTKSPRLVVLVNDGRIVETRNVKFVETPFPYREAGNGAKTSQEDQDVCYKEMDDFLAQCELDFLGDGDQTSGGVGENTNASNTSQGVVDTSAQGQAGSDVEILTNPSDVVEGPVDGVPVISTLTDHFFIGEQSMDDSVPPLVENSSDMDLWLCCDSCDKWRLVDEPSYQAHSGDGVSFQYRDLTTPDGQELNCHHPGNPDADEPAVGVHGIGVENVSVSAKKVLNGPDKEEWLAAMKKEFDALEKMGAYKRISFKDVKDYERIVAALLLLNLKSPDADGHRRKKARVVVDGSQEKEYAKQDVFAGVVSYNVFRLCASNGFVMGWDSKSVDVSTAFLQSEVDPNDSQRQERLIVRPPRYHPDHGQCLWEVVSALYGQKRAPQLWRKTIHRWMLSQGFEASSYEESLYFHKKDKQLVAIVILYVDDVVVWGSTRFVDCFLKQLSDKFITTPADMLREFPWQQCEVHEESGRWS